MKIRMRKAVLVALVALGLGFVLPEAWAQQQTQKSAPAPAQTAQPPAQGQAAPQVTAPATPPEAPKLNPEEEAGYKAFSDLKLDNPQALISTGEAFLKKFPESRYCASVYAKLADAYRSTNQEDKMFAAGEKAIDLDSNNIAALTLMAYTMPRRYNPNELGADQKLQKAGEYAKRAIALLGTMQKPVNLTDAQFTRAKNEGLASCHSGLGLVYFYQRDFPQMVTELEQATQLDVSPDSVDLYLLGFAYEQVKRYSDAVKPLTQCSEIAGPMQDRCKGLLEQAKKAAASEPAPAKP